MKNAFRGEHADRVVLVCSDDSGLAMGRHLMAEGASVPAVGPFGELRNVGAFAREKSAEREESVLVHWRHEKKEILRI